MKKSEVLRLLRPLDMVARLDIVISSAALFAIVMASILGVIFRYIFKSPLGWIEEVSLSLFIWLTFFGASILSRRGELVTIEFLLAILPSRISHLIKRVLVTAVVVFCIIFIIIYGFQLVSASTKRFTAILRIPYNLIYLGIPLGSIFILYNFLRFSIFGPVFLEDTIDGEPV